MKKNILLLSFSLMATVSCKSHVTNSEGASTGTTGFGMNTSVGLVKNSNDFYTFLVCEGSYSYYFKKVEKGIKQSKGILVDLSSYLKKTKDVCWTPLMKDKKTQFITAEQADLFWQNSGKNSVTVLCKEDEECVNKIHKGIYDHEKYHQPFLGSFKIRQSISYLPKLLSSSLKQWQKNELNRTE